MELDFIQLIQNYFNSNPEYSHIRINPITTLSYSSVEIGVRCTLCNTIATYYTVEGSMLPSNKYSAADYVCNIIAPFLKEHDHISPNKTAIGYNISYAAKASKLVSPLEVGYGYPGQIIPIDGEPYESFQQIPLPSNAKEYNGLLKIKQLEAAQYAATYGTFYKKNDPYDSIQKEPEYTNAVSGALSQEVLKQIFKLSDFNVSFQGRKNKYLKIDYRLICGKCNDIFNIDEQNYKTYILNNLIYDGLKQFCKKHTHAHIEEIITVGRKFKHA